MDDAKALIDKLGLAPHPEGGWYRETWRAPDTTGAGDWDRAIATAILFLLDEGERSHWHRVDASEIWLWHAGSPLTLLTAPDDAGSRRDAAPGRRSAGRPDAADRHRAATPGRRPRRRWAGGW